MRVPQAVIEELRKAEATVVLRGNGTAGVYRRRADSVYYYGELQKIELTKEWTIVATNNPGN